MIGEIIRIQKEIAQAIVQYVDPIDKIVEIVNKRSPYEIVFGVGGSTDVIIRNKKTLKEIK